MLSCKISCKAATLCLLLTSVLIQVCNEQSLEGLLECELGEICVEKEDGTKFCKKECLQDCTDVAELFGVLRMGRRFKSIEMLEDKDACGQSNEQKSNREYSGQYSSNGTALRYRRGTMANNVLLEKLCLQEENH